MSSSLTPSSQPRVTAVVLAYGPEAHLVACVNALLGSVDVLVDVVLVDNGCTSTAVEDLAGHHRVRTVGSGVNRGFAGGCNFGAGFSAAPILLFVNSDAVVDDNAARALVDALEEPGVGIASASLRILEQPATINSAGNPVHFLGLSWAGGLGESAAAHAVPHRVASATGAAMALRRGVWRDLGGFWEPMFAYGEDMELSWRCWQRGLSVQYVPHAIVKHAYEFRRNPQKFYLLERNRVAVLLTLYERRTLIVLAPPLIALELAVLVVAFRQGWGRQKVRGWWWLLVHAGTLHRRRQSVQSRRNVSDAELAELFVARFSPNPDTGFAAPLILDRAAALYWRAAKRWI